MKWILVALGGLAMISLSAWAVGARPLPVTEWAALDQVRAASAAPAEIGAPALPAGTQLGGPAAVQVAPKAAPTATSPVQGPANPASGIVKPGCGGVSRAGKAAPLCPPG